MATWIGHLRVAEGLLQHWPHLDRMGFAFGNLAPDSGVPNADWSSFDPPKEVTHFLSKGQGEGEIRDLEFYRAYLASLKPDGSVDYAFRLGYFVHLVCDRIWHFCVATAFKRDHAKWISQEGAQAWWKAKEDWYGQDFAYLATHPKSLFFELIEAPVPSMPVERIPTAAFADQMNYIRQFYLRTPDWPLDRLYPYLNAATMERYVQDSIALMLQGVPHLADRCPSEVNSLLDLLPPLEPYSAPLGD